MAGWAWVDGTGGVRQGWPHSGAVSCGGAAGPGGAAGRAEFTLRWDHSAESRAGLAERVFVGDREVTLFELLLQIFQDRGLRVDLR